MNITMEDVLKAKFGENSGKVKAKYRRTINIRQYESEVIEMEAELDIQRPMSGAERIGVEAMLKCQLEFEVNTSIFAKGYMAEAEYALRKQQLELELNSIENKLNVVCGESLSKFIV